MRHRRRGVSLVEALLALALVTITFFFLSTTFQMGTGHAGQSRNYALATVLAASLEQDIRSHPYGRPKPARWGPADCDADSGKGLMVEDSFMMVVEGREVKTTFYYCVSVAYDQGGNGSFFGGSTQDQDALKISVRWDDGDAESLDLYVQVRRSYVP